MKKSELKALIKEVVKENMFARQHPDGDKKFGDAVPGVWDNPTEVEKLKKQLMQAIDAGNFDVAQRKLLAIAEYHN